MSGCRTRIVAPYAAGLIMFAPLFLLAQTGSGNQRGSSRGNNSNSNSNSTPAAGINNANPATAAVIRTVSGRVVNGITGVPIPRALVNMNGRAVLTDPQGKFSFPGFDQANGFAVASKPGYAQSLSPDIVRQQRIPDLDALVELKLYPNATITGLVTGPDGLPLSRLQVRLRRLSFDATGQRWQQAGFTQTDLHGDYRFDVPPGRYHITTGYTARSVERGEAVLPAGFPAGSSSVDETFELGSGEQRQVDLRPRVSPGYPVSISVDGGERDRGVRLTVSTTSGLTFQLQTRNLEDTLTAQLPLGTFLLRATGGDREDATTGETRVTVTGRGTAEAQLHMVPLPEFPVEVNFEIVPPISGSATPSTPSAQNFNLTLRDVNNIGEGFASDIRLTIRPDHSAYFKIPPGRYRLGGNVNGTWHIRSATLGVTDLLTEEFLVAPASGGAPIRMSATNAMGYLKGIVTTAGQPATGWVYLISEQPSLVPYFEIYIQSDGSYQWYGPPGKYIAVLEAQQVRDDFRNPVFLRKFTAAGREVEITNGTDVSVDLTQTPVGVAR